MRIITHRGLSRGSAFLDSAMLSTNDSKEIGLSDLIGLIAAYAGRDLPAKSLFGIIAEQFGTAVGRRCEAAFDLFTGEQGQGLWMKDATRDRIVLTHPTLQKSYPVTPPVNGRQ